MFERRAFPAIVLTLALLSGSAGAQIGQVAEDESLAPVGSALRNYAEARTAGRGIDAARADLVRALAGLREETGAGHPLRLCADLGRAFWLSRDYARIKVRRGKVMTEAVPGGSFGDAGLEFAYRLPKDYDAAARAYPLILAIPDVDEDPAHHLRANWKLRELLDGAILVSPAMPESRAEWPHIMVAGRPGGLCHVLSALRIASERFAVDPDRVYVAGRGKGVPAAVAAGNVSPQLFAGVVGRAGEPAETGPENFGNLPTYFAGGGARTTAFRDAVDDAGFRNCTSEPAGKERDIWSWIREHARATYPDQVSVTPGDPFPTRAYWLRVSPIASDSSTTATIHRSTNSIEIVGEGVSHAILYLNDALVDLDQPVRVVANGVVHDALIPRSLPTALELLHDGTSDASSVYVCEVVFAMTEEAASLSATGAGGDADFDQRLGAAGDDPALLWSLHQWCMSTQRSASSARALQKLLRIDPNHEHARDALGHERLGDRWFISQESLDRYRRSQEPDVAESRGLVEYKSQWMHADERPLLTKGWTKDIESGQWLTPADQKRLASGWVRQDLEWIHPEETGRLDQGLWRVDGEWVDLQEANRRHARVDSPWSIPGADVLLIATTDRAVALRAQREMTRAVDDLRRVFGAEPVLPLRVALLRDEEQYDRFAFGAPDGRRAPTHTGRLHVIHSAFFAESWFARVEGRREYQGMGVGYWNSVVPNGDAYGVHSARLAVGLSFVDALDPSPKAVRKATVNGPGPGFHGAFLREKRFPAWLRYGAAVYAERFFTDASVAEGGDPWWARKWSIDNIRARGGLRELSQILACELDPDDREDSQKLLIEAGLVVAFVVDGVCEPVAAEHAAFRRALSTQRLRASHITALTEAIVAHESELRAFAGL